MRIAGAGGHHCQRQWQPQAAALPAAVVMVRCKGRSMAALAKQDGIMLQRPIQEYAKCHNVCHQHTPCA